MAEHSTSSSGTPITSTTAISAPQLHSRRVSFRTSISDPTLPPAYLDQLEQKRRQLDESIHKYIASKEREYKNLQRDLRQQARDPVSDTSRCGPVSAAAEARHSKRRTSSESTTLSTTADTDGTSFVIAHRPSSSRSECLLEDGKEEEGVTEAEREAALAALANRRPSVDRDKDLAGLFTLPFLSALQMDKENPTASPRAPLPRAMSAPTPSSPTTVDKEPSKKAAGDLDPKRAQSDPSMHSSMQAKAKRPSQIALASRTSSSGSSADGRLTSAMKSPTKKERPRRKRVSLAVGDFIVAPSDSVPVSLNSSNHAPSHSRSKSPSVQEKAAVVEGLVGEKVDGWPVATSSVHEPEQNLDPVKHLETEAAHDQPAQVMASDRAPSGRNPTATNHTAIDPDGDLFDLEEDEDGGLVRHGPDELNDDESAEDSDNSRRDNSRNDAQPPSSPALITYMHHDPNPADPSLNSEPESEDGSARGVHLDFQPGSIVASQQPTDPGFRRPSVSRDPIFAGGDYPRAATRAAEDEIYGSSYGRPARGSFTAGSLGESFMERHAVERRMRAANTLSRREGEVKS